MQPSRFPSMFLATWSCAITRNARGKPLRRKSTENGNTRNRRFYHLRQKTLWFWRVLLQESSGPQIASRCLQMFHGCDASQMPPRCLQLNRYTDTQTSSHRVNSAGDHKKQLFGVARRSHIYKKVKKTYYMSAGEVYVVDFEDLSIDVFLEVQNNRYS